MEEDHSSCESDRDEVENCRKHNTGELLDVEDLGNVLVAVNKSKVCVYYCVSQMTNFAQYSVY